MDRSSARGDETQPLFRNSLLYRSFHCGVKIWLNNEAGGFGPGCYNLMKAIEKNGSVKKACEELNISYSKGWGMLREAESELGMKLVERQQGGTGGGKAKICPEGAKLLEMYEVMQTRIRDIADQIVQEETEKYFHSSE